MKTRKLRTKKFDNIAPLIVIIIDDMTLSFYCYSECHLLSVIMLSVIMLTVVMLSIIMLSVVILSVIC
jgi:hypothetical protein